MPSFVVVKVEKACQTGMEVPHNVKLPKIDVFAIGVVP